MENQKKRSFWAKIRDHYRLVVMNDDTFEEQFSYKLTPLNIIVLTGLVSIVMITITVSLVAFTPLKEFIPGYGSEIQTRKELLNMAMKVDSLNVELEENQLMLDNLSNILSGNIAENDSSSSSQKVTLSTGEIKAGVIPSREDSAFRAEIESQDRYSLSISESKTARAGISGYFFFTPVKGTITASYNAAKEHYGVDIAGQENEAIKATLDGTVLFAGWTSETGYTVQLQHSNNLVSAYKHNSVILKKAGQFVRAGEAIAVIGNSGEQTTGPHLHFELWHNGSAIDPQDYIVF